MYRWMMDRLEVGKIKGIDFFSFLSLFSACLQSIMGVNGQ